MRRLLILGASCLAACNLSGDVSLDGGRGDALEASPDAAETGLEDAEVDGGRVAGPITLVADERGMIADRLCDHDGDGLERFELDDDFFIARCIDGDGTVVEGHDCWEDERIADGFAFVASMHLVPAVFAGLEPGWQGHGTNPEDCDEPPETSLWDPR